MNEMGCRNHLSAGRRPEAGACVDFPARMLGRIIFGSINISVKKKVDSMIYTGYY